MHPWVRAVCISLPTNQSLLIDRFCLKGKGSPEALDEDGDDDDEDEDNDDNDNDESDSHEEDEDVEMEMNGGAAAGGNVAEAG